MTQLPATSLSTDMGSIPNGSEMSAEEIKKYKSEKRRMENIDKLIGILAPWVVAINGVSLAEEVANKIVDNMRGRIL